MIKSADAVVVGGGVLGASIAHFLVKRGYGTVALVERGELASGATGYSAANVRQHYSTEVGIRLAVRGAAIFEHSEEELGGPTGFSRCGYMVIAPHGEEEAIRTVVPLQRALGVRTRFLEIDEVAELYPDLVLEDIALACLEENSGYADPKLTVRTLVEAATRRGLHCYQGTRVVDIEMSGGSVKGVRTDAGDIATPLVVNAAGPWARAIGEMVGVDHELVFSREHEAVFRVPDELGRLPVVSDAAQRIFFRPAGPGQLLIGEGYPKEMEPCDPESYDDKADDRVVDRMVAKLVRRVPRLAESLGAEWRPSVARSYAGVYSITPDWYPIVGFWPGLEGYVTAIGGSGHAFKIGPPIGEALADLICGESPEIDISPLGVERFERKELMSSVWGPGNRA